MRTINNTHLNCPARWDQKADNAKAAVANGTKTVKSQSAVWRELKEALAECSSDKCWYCEIKQERSDNAVDHFRPKSLYPWLAFEKTNFRYACTYCNSERQNPETGEIEGKGDRFPLIDGNSRATVAGQEVHESPVLLDPCRAQDPGLLDFYDDGMPCPKFKEHPVKKLRAETSIKLFHLDHPDLVEKRKTLGATIKESIGEADGIFDRCDTGDPAIDRAFHGIIRNLRDAIADKAELSTFARKVIAGFRDKVWIEALLDTA
ncbi:MAG: hypothetical protein KJ630_21355 [Proteobacteria bacterium]|nr:hypothetical protein [Pseudomonadota bacterium]